MVSKTKYTNVCFSSVQSLSRIQHFATPWTAAYHGSLSITNSWRLLKLMSIEWVMPSNHLILCRPILLLPSSGDDPQKERGSGTSLSKAEGSRGEVSLLSANPAPQRARDNQTRQGFRLSSSALLPQTLGLYRQARGFCEGLSIVAPITLKVKS